MLPERRRGVHHHITARQGVAERARLQQVGFEQLDLVTESNEQWVVPPVRQTADGGSDTVPLLMELVDQHAAQVARRTRDAHQAIRAEA